MLLFVKFNDNFMNRQIEVTTEGVLFSPTDVQAAHRFYREQNLQQVGAHGIPPQQAWNTEPRQPLLCFDFTPAGSQHVLECLPPGVLLRITIRCWLWLIVDSIES